MAQIIKRGSKWQYRVWFNDPETGKQKSVSKSGFTTKREATQAALDMEVKKKQNKLTSKENITFIDYYEKWIDANKIGHVRPSTERGYIFVKGVLSRHPIAYKRLNKITKLDYQTFLNDYANGTSNKTEHKRSRASVKRVSTLIHPAIRDAIDDGIIYSDFVRKAHFLGKDPKSSNLKYLELDEAQKLKYEALKKANMKDGISYCIMVFALATGCRYGEIVGLTWDCVDFENSKITINKGYDYQKRTGFQKLKTVTSNRTISIDSDTTKMLQNLKKEQNIIFFKQGFRNTQQFVFINRFYQVPKPSSVAQLMHKILQKIGAKNQKLTMHGLRHTHASILLSKGVSLDYVSQRLGHKNTIVTSQIYAHLLKEKEQREDKKAVEILADL